MPEKKNNTVTYDLKQGRKVVYKGTTNDPERRAKEHQGEGKQFSKLHVTSRRMTEEGAKRKEQKDLAQYRTSHEGKNPQYNEDDSG